MIRLSLTVGLICGLLGAVGIVLLGLLLDENASDRAVRQAERQVQRIVHQSDDPASHVKALMTDDETVGDCDRLLAGKPIHMLHENGKAPEAAAGLAWPGDVSGEVHLKMGPMPGCETTADFEIYGVVQQYPGGRFAVAQVVEREAVRWSERLVIALLLLAACTGVSFAIGHRFERRFNARVQQLNDVLDRAEKSGFQARVEHDAAAGATFNALIEHVNGLILRMGDLTGNLSRLTLHIAHDLRSPLEVLQRHLRRLHSQLQNTAVASEVSEARAKVTAVMQRCEQLLAIARIETASTASFTSIALREMLTMLADDIFLDRSTSLDIHVALDAPIEISVPGQPEMLQRLFTNLMHNAQKFANAGSTIRIILRREGVMARVTIENDGPIVAEGRLEEIFDPQVATSVTSGGGYGLGLPFVRAAARRHGGEAFAEPHRRGMRMIVRLPAQKYLDDGS